MKKALLLITICLSCNAIAGDSARFVGDLKAQLTHTDGRKIILLDDFRFIDSKGTVWLAPKGWVVDGASIPRFAWTIIGGPLDGPYRSASVIHDVACDQKNHPWKDVHRMFYEGMLAEHVGAIKAKIMYAAVYHFGPRWEYQKIIQKTNLADIRRDAGTVYANNRDTRITVYAVEFPMVASTEPPEGKETEINLFDPAATYATESTLANADFVAVKVDEAPRTLSENDFDKIKADIEQKNPTLEEIEEYHP